MSRTVIYLEENEKAVLSQVPFKELKLKQHENALRETQYITWMSHYITWTLFSSPRLHHHVENVERTFLLWQTNEIKPTLITKNGHSEPFCPYEAAVLKQTNRLPKNWRKGNPSTLTMHRRRVMNIAECNQLVAWPEHLQLKGNKKDHRERKGKIPFDRSRCH
jgi:hypothetical protein